MASQQKPDRSNRIILLVLGVLAIVTIGATILATTTEWNQPPLPESETRTEPVDPPTP